MVAITHHVRTCIRRISDENGAAYTENISEIGRTCRGLYTGAAYTPTSESYFHDFSEVRLILRAAFIPEITVVQKQR